MMRRAAAAAAGLVAVMAAIGGAAGPAGDARQLYGIWVLVSAEENGHPVPAETIATSTHQMIFQKDGYTDVFKGKKGTVVFKGTYKIDPSKAPAEIDLATYAGKTLGPTFPAIYEVKGDTLTICTPLEGKQRPAQFTTIGAAICVFKKQTNYP